MATVALAFSASAAELNCHGATNVESFHYTWRLRGGLSFVAAIMFPTSGNAELKTTFPKPGEHAIASELLITAADGKTGFFVYESQIEAASNKTMMTYHGYSWKNKSRKERTFFDYVKRIAHLHKETPEKTWDRTEPMPDDPFHDVLTAIYYLRQNATSIRGPVATTIYSDGKSYPVLMRPAERRTFDFDGQKVTALGFEIVDAPGGKKWPGGVRVWVSEDSRRIPFRIEIVQSMASLQLDLSSVEACRFLQASAP